MRGVVAVIRRARPGSEGLDRADRPCGPRVSPYTDPGREGADEDYPPSPRKRPGEVITYPATSLRTPARNDASSVELSPGTAGAPVARPRRPAKLSKCTIQDHCSGSSSRPRERMIAAREHTISRHSPFTARTDEGRASPRRSHHGRSKAPRRGKSPWENVPSIRRSAALQLSSSPALQLSSVEPTPFSSAVSTIRRDWAARSGGSPRRRPPLKPLCRWHLNILAIWY